MAEAPGRVYEVAVIVTPLFNLAATMNLIDPLRAANYLHGRPLYRWHLLSLEGGPVQASNRLVLGTDALGSLAATPDLAVVSTSWTPEAFRAPVLLSALRRWARFGATLAAIDTGAFVLGAAGLLKNRRATVHYEHLDAFIELYPNVEAVEDLYVLDGDRLSCAGGAAATDMALQIMRSVHGEAVANASARYIFHGQLRAPGSMQNPDHVEPLGATAPAKLRAAIKVMEAHLEEVLPIPAVAAKIGLSQRQLERLFAHYVGKSPRQYYRDIRLDRARGLVTQTEMPFWEIAMLCGFSSPEHFSRAYSTRFGLAPRFDRVEGRVPFEFRAWPMHSIIDKGSQ